MGTGQKLSSSVRDFLKRDHARIEGLHARLLDELGRESPGARREMWYRFEVAVLDHMAAEERHLLKRFAHVHRREAAALRGQHAQFRRTLARLAADLDRHGGELQQFITSLCEHARREDRLLYEWAEHELDEATGQTITRELAGRSRATASRRQA